MGRTRSPARLVIALSVAAVLAVFLVYTAIAGGTPSISPSQLHGRTDRVTVGGVVVGPLRGDAHQGGLRFAVRDSSGKGSIRVSYTGSVPDLFKVGRHVAVTGSLRNGLFVADDLVTKCPSKYTPAKA